MKQCVHKVCRSALAFAATGLLVLATIQARAQVSPDEVLNPRAKADEQNLLPQLQLLQQEIGELKLPFTFRLARYLHAKPGQRAALDSNGLEFVSFQQRVVLKVSGVYKAAYNSAAISKNQRAARTFQDVVVPVLRLIAQRIPQSADYDGIGFEILYDARDNSGEYDYEGKEVLSIVFGRDDAFKYANTTGMAERQQLLNRSEIYVNGEEFGLALGKREPLNVLALERSIPRRAEEQSAANPIPVDSVSGATISPALSVTQAPAAPTSPATFADAMRLQMQFQPQLNAIAQEDGARFHLAEDTAPSFEIDGDRTTLHFTLRNTNVFERGTTSIYKRAAQSFDLFLAPELRDLTRKLPAKEGFDALEFSVLNRLGTGKEASETIDYICPMESMRAFVANKITSQELIDRSVVLVDGVRIGLNLQLVE